ncbi:MAG: PAS domain S-box protein [Sphingobacteriales bacterium]|nr:MAG: PAS domain S-box protein [Sphingobacteriales bacterium]
MLEDIFSFRYGNWFSVLLAGLPALLNVAIAIYVKRSLPRSGTTRLFFLLLLCVISWQVSDMLTRMCTTELSAAFWDAVLSTGWIYVAPFALHFAFHFTGRKKLAEKTSTKFLLYAPAAFFDAIFKITYTGHAYKYLENWGWLDNRSGNLFENILVNWIAVLAIITSAILFRFAVSNYKNNKLTYHRSLIIAIGFTIPVVQGTITEIIVPALYNTPPFTVTSTFFSFFSVGAAIALRKYNLFKVPDFVENEVLLEIIDDIVITASQNQKLTYINTYGAKCLGLAKEKIENYTLTDLFYSLDLYIDFLKNTSTAHNKNQEIQNYETTIVAKNGQQMQVLISTKNIENGESDQHVLIVARDITSLKEAQAKIQTSEKRFRAIIENSNDAMVMFDENGHISYNSPAAAPLLGFGNGELKDRNIDELIHPEDKSQIAEKLATVIHMPAMGVNMTLRARHKSGEWLWIEGSCINLLHQAGVNAIVGNFRNITERMRIEKDRQEAFALFDSIIKNINAGILIEDESHNIYFLNEDFCKLFSVELPLNSLIGENALLLLENYKSKVKTPANFATELLKISQCRIPVPKQEVIFDDGRIFELDYMPIYTQNNEFIGHFWKYTNVTERVRTLENIRQQTAYMQELYNASPYGIIMLDRNDIVLTANSAFEKLFGFAMEEMKGKYINSMIVPPHLQQEASDVSQSCISKQAVQLESKRMRKDGSLIDVLIVGYPIVIEDTYCGIYGIYADISERKKAEEDLVSKNLQLVKINKELDQFVYSASHDIRAPLMSILGLINLSETVTNDDELLQYLDMMRTSINKLDGFITDIIHYSKNAQTQIQVEEIDFEPFVLDIYNQLRFLRKTRELTIRISNKTAGRTFYSDKSRLSNILTNLVSNAIKYHNYNQENPYIVVTLEIVDDNALIFIKDNGAGIPQDKQPFIFDMFYRANENATGSGLGLYIVKEIIEKLGGYISFSSIPNEGTSFEISLPNFDLAGEVGTEMQQEQLSF